MEMLKGGDWIFYALFYQLNNHKSHISVIRLLTNALLSSV